MRAILLAAIAAAGIGLAGAGASAAPINGAAIGQAADQASEIENVHWRGPSRYWRGGYHWRYGSRGFRRCHGRYSSRMWRC